MEIGTESKEDGYGGTKSIGWQLGGCKEDEGQNARESDMVLTLG